MCILSIEKVCMHILLYFGSKMMKCHFHNSRKVFIISHDWMNRHPCFLFFTSPVMLKVKSECDSLFRQYEKCQRSYPDNAQRCSGRFNAFLDCVEMVASSHSWQSHSISLAQNPGLNLAFSFLRVYLFFHRHLIHIYMTHKSIILYFKVF